MEVKDNTLTIFCMYSKVTAVQNISSRGSALYKESQEILKRN